MEEKSKAERQNVLKWKYFDMKFSRNTMFFVQIPVGQHHHLMPNKTDSWAETEKNNRYRKQQTIVYVIAENKLIFNEFYE